MRLSLYGFLKDEARQIQERKDRIVAMLHGFNADGAVEADPQLTASAAQLSTTWLADQLSRPETAVLRSVCGRLYSTRTLFLVGQIESQSVTSRTCSNWFVIEFDLVEQSASGAMLDEAPFIRENLPPVQLPVEPVTSVEPGEKRRISPMFWLLVLLAAALAIATIGLAAIR